MKISTLDTETSEQSELVEVGTGEKISTVQLVAYIFKLFAICLFSMVIMAELMFFVAGFGFSTMGWVSLVCLAMLCFDFVWMLFRLRFRDW